MHNSISNANFSGRGYLLLTTIPTQGGTGTANKDSNSTDKDLQGQHYENTRHTHVLLAIVLLLSLKDNLRNIVVTGYTQKTLRNKDFGPVYGPILYSSFYICGSYCRSFRVRNIHAKIGCFYPTYLAQRAPYYFYSVHILYQIPPPQKKY